MPQQPFADLLTESLDEAQFLWRRFEQELASLTRNLDEIDSWTEDRLQGALDGVRVAPPGQFEDLLAESLTGDDSIKTTVAAHLLATANSERAKTLLVEAVRTATGPKLAAILRGFEVAELDGGFAPVAAAMQTSGPEQRAALCALKAFRRATLGQELVDTYESKIPALQSMAIRASAFLSSERVDAWIKAGLESSDKSVRTEAIVTGIRRRNTPAWHGAVQLARMGHEEAKPLLGLVAMFGGALEQQAVLAAVDAAPLRAAAVQALGTLGTREAAERCIEAMSDAAVARIAGEAYCTITGAELERDRLTAPEPEADAPTFEDDDLNADLVPRGAATWPLPDVDRVRAHWQSVQRRFAPGMRHTSGRPLDVGALIAAVESGPMLRRPEWSFELAVRTGNQYDVECRAFVGQQRHMMSASRARVGA